MAIEVKQIKPKKNVMVNKDKTKIAKLFILLNKDISLFSKGLSDKKKESLYGELSILLSSGIDMRTSLEIIMEEQTLTSMKLMFKQVYEGVIGGQSISDALFQTGKFSLYEYHSLRIGEESGRMKEVLADLTLYFSKKIKQKRQLSGVFTYPAMVILTALVVVVFMLKFIVPMFTEVFNRFDGGLPPLTKLIINMSESFSRNLGFLIFVLSGIIITAWHFRNKEWYRRYVSVFLLKLPLFGHIINKIYLARFCQNMALLLGSKTPMLKAIQLVQNMIGFYPFELALKVIENDIMHGKMLNQSMQQFPIFDKRMVALTRIAEEVNRLHDVFGKLNTQYSDELEHQIGLIGNLLEPAMIIIVGLFVAIILISMYLPLFQISTSIM